jgi:heat shock protein HslJ
MGDCASGSMPEVPWLERVSGFVAVSGGYELVDASGHTVAALTIDGAPKPIATAAEFFAQPPPITPEVTKAFRTPSPLPAGVEPATAEALLGTWVPVAYQVSTDPHVTFTADGRWKGSDGCNGGGGRFAVGDAGMMLTTAGPSTLIGCEGAPVPTWLGQATSAGFDRGWLLLFGLDGNEVGRLDRG